MIKFCALSGGENFVEQNLTIKQQQQPNKNSKKSWSRLMNRFHLQPVQHLKLVNMGTYKN